MGVDHDTATRWADEDAEMNPLHLTPGEIASSIRSEYRGPLHLYTAGPMSWRRHFNYEAFQALAEALRAEGYAVTSPAELDSPEMQAKCEASEDGDPTDLGTDETWGDLLSRDVKLIADEVDGVVLLPGWEASKGARLEAFVARHVGKPVFYWIGGADGLSSDEALHNAICHCHLIDWMPRPGDYVNFAMLLELDDAELDHVLLASDVDVLMKIQRDEVYESEDFQPEWEQRIAKTNSGSRVVWMADEGGFDDPLPESAFGREDRFDGLIPNRDAWPETDAEVRKVDPDTGGEKGSKQARFDLIPTGPLHQIARHYGVGAEKYDDRNWERGYAWSLSYAAMQRHLNAWWGGEDIDDETKSSHLTAAAWHCLALMEWTYTHPEKDDRP